MTRNSFLALGLVLAALSGQAQTKQAPKKPAAPAKKATVTAAPMGKLDRSKKPGPGPAPKIQIGKSEQFTLANGLKVFVVTNRKLPRVAYNLVLDYDPIFEGEQAGYVELAGGLLGEGTTHRSKDSLNAEIDFMGADLNTSASNIFASGLKRYAPKLMEIMSDVLLHPAFDTKELDKLKTEKISALANEKNSPGAISNKVVAKLLFGTNHPYGEFATEETVKKITVEKCREFYNTYFRPEVGYLAIVGDISLAEAKPLVEKYFSGWQRGNVPKHTYPALPAPSQPVVAIVNRPSSVQSNITIAQALDMKPGAPDAILAEVSNDILGGGSSARLFTNLREKHGWTYGSYSNISPDRVMGRFTATAQVRNAVTDSAVGEMLNELGRLGKDLSQDEELVLSRNSNTGSFVMSLEQPQTLAYFAINTARYNLPADYYQNYLTTIASIKAEDVRTLSSKYIRPGQAYIVVVGNANDVADKLKKYGQIKYFDEQGNPTTASLAKPAPAGVTAQSVLTKYIDATGGAAAYAKLKDYSAFYKAEVQGQALELETYKKSPDKSLTIMKVGGQTLVRAATDGKGSKQGGMMGEKKLEGNDLARNLVKSRINYEANPAAYGLTTTLQGVEQVEGKDAYKVEFKMAGGEAWTEFFDVATGVKVRDVTMQKGRDGTPAPQQMDLGDYKEIGKTGVKIAGTRTLTMGPQTIKFELQKTEANTKLKDDIFSAQ